MTMCHWGGANSDPNSPNSEEEQQHQRYQEDDRTSVASRRSHRPQQVPPMPAFPPIRDRQGAPSVSGRRSGTYQGGTFELPPLPPSTGSLNSVGRTTITRPYSLHPRREGPSKTLPNELLEDIFLLAIASSFPIEDPNWPLCPMFSKRSAKPHAPIPTAELLKTAPQLLPTILSQTSRRFRTVLRNAPHLWSHIHITRTVSPSKASNPSPHASSSGGSPIYLARSRESGLHITFGHHKVRVFLRSALNGHDRPELRNGLYLRSCSQHSLAGPPITILTSHIGSPALGPLLHFLSPLGTPALTHLRLAADIWRTGIVGYGAPVPALFVGGSPLLHSVTLEGVHLDWKSWRRRTSSCGSSQAGIRGGSVRRAPEEGVPPSSAWWCEDDFDEAVRSIDPPPMPYFDEPASPLPPHSPFSTGSTGSNSNASGQTPSSSSTSPASGRFPSHIAGLHLTLPPSSHHGQGRGRGRSQSTSSSTSSGSSSTSTGAAPARTAGVPEDQPPLPKKAGTPQLQR
ncbi:hypothetical protein DFP72DRAFT_921616 [Ephemerocybe angulata]|uniref:F-box domain-containing protein n=1 Tax=Ephemerocybe angulata TaxID=980116 RepID=A0A8H6HH69_9AGAR|nr:hypothetical protein DFP72DRAFT_921616 [Tulosesus angulatus]